WLWRAAYAQYHTILHVAVLFASILAISLWFLLFGSGSKKIRRRVVGGVWVPVIRFLGIFCSVFNGGHGGCWWRLRFASNADQKLQQLTSKNAAADWQTTPHDYPRFLGTGYWAEVKGTDLETDWQAHPPRELWRHEIGAGWSAFAVVGDYAVTQE